MRTVRAISKKLDIHTAFDVYGAIKLAHTLFLIDNLKEINRLSPPVKVRDEAEFLNFTTGLVSQGFEIADYKKMLMKQSLW